MDSFTWIDTPEYRCYVRRPAPLGENMDAVPDIDPATGTDEAVLEEYTQVERTLALLLDGLVGIGDRVACVQSAFFEARSTLPGSAEEYAQRNQTSKSNLYRLHKTARRRWSQVRRRSPAYLEPWQRIRNLIEQHGDQGLTTDSIVDKVDVPEDVALSALASLMKTGAVVRERGRIRLGESFTIATKRAARRNLGLYIQGSLARIIQKRIAAAEGSDPYEDDSTMGQGERSISMELVPELQRRIHESVRSIADEFEAKSAQSEDCVRFQHIIGTHILDTPVAGKGTQS